MKVFLGVSSNAIIGFEPFWHNSAMFTMFRNGSQLLRLIEELNINRADARQRNL